MNGEKDALRRLMRQRLRQFSQQQLAELSLPVIERMRILVGNAKVVLVYWSLPDEVDTHHLVDEWVTEGRIVLLPKVLDGQRMELRRYTGRQDLREGAFHIMEPCGESFADFSAIEIAFVPGMAFDALGHRLGRGKGYYDRFLSEVSALWQSCQVLGVCFDFQKVPTVPTGNHDIAVEALV